MKTEDWQVIVGNIGTVYNGPSAVRARHEYESYVADSRRGYGLAAGEDVTLMRDGEPIAEHFGDATAPGLT